MLYFKSFLTTSICGSLSEDRVDYRPAVWFKELPRRCSHCPHLSQLRPQFLSYSKR
jgi:hypothetical protein